MKSHLYIGGQTVNSVAGHRESGKASSEPLNIFEDHPVNMDITMSQLGDKNQHHGPRIRDAKKAARANGALKLAFKVISGPNGAKKKVNKNPNLKGPDKGKLPIISGPNLPKNRSRKERALLKESLEEQLNEVPITKVPGLQSLVEDTNPLLGFISPPSEDTGKKFSPPVDIIKQDESHQNGILLSEQPTPSGSL